MNNNNPQCPSRRYEITKDIIALIVGLVTTVAAVYIPLTIDRSSKQSEALKFVASFNERIGNINRKIVEKLAKDNNAYTYQAISDSNNMELEKNVFELLNEYEAFSYAVLHDIISEDTALGLRRDTTLETWERYEKYIRDYRAKKTRSDAWIELERLVNKIKTSKKWAPQGA